MGPLTSARISRPGPWTPVDTQIEAWFPPDTHPYRILEREIDERLSPETCVLDIGCGRTAPNLSRLKGRAKTLVGVDREAFAVDLEGLTLLRTDAATLEGVSASSIDLAYSRAVMEHIEHPEDVFAQLWRVLKPGGAYVFLTPSKFDYASIIARMVPNRFHGRLVELTEGRAQRDVFPTFYRCNSARAINELAARHGFEIEFLRNLGQYPAYLRFSRTLFWVGGLYEKLLDKVPPLAPLKGWILASIVKPMATAPEPARHGARVQREGGVSDRT